MKVESYGPVSKTGICSFFFLFVFVFPMENNAEMDGLAKKKLRWFCFSTLLLPFGPVTPCPGAWSHS